MVLGPGIRNGLNWFGPVPVGTSTGSIRGRPASPLTTRVVTVVGCGSGSHLAPDENFELSQARNCCSPSLPAPGLTVQALIFGDRCLTGVPSRIDSLSTSLTQTRPQTTSHTAALKGPGQLLYNCKYIIMPSRDMGHAHNRRNFFHLYALIISPSLDP